MEILWLLRVTQKRMHTIRNDSMKSALLLVVISKLGAENIHDRHNKGKREECEYGEFK